LSTREISALLKIDQAEVSKLMNGKYHPFSEGRLFGFLNKLDRKVIVQISPRKKATARRKLSLHEMISLHGNIPNSMKEAPKS